MQIIMTGGIYVHQWSYKYQIKYIKHSFAIQLLIFALYYSTVRNNL
jgi:hypothetical protein